MSTDGSASSDDVWFQASLLHLRQELHCLVRLLRLPTCTDGSVARDTVWLQAYLLHVRKELQRPLTLH